MIPNYNGYALVITEHVWSLDANGTRYHSDNIAENNPFVFEHSELKQRINSEWYSTIVGATLRQRAVSYRFNNNVDRAVVGAGIEGSTWIPSYGQMPDWQCNRATVFEATSGVCFDAISRPDGQAGEGELFILSGTEVNTFFNPDDESSENGIGIYSKRAYGGESHGWALGNADATPRHWWLRSPGHSENSSVRIVNSNGNFDTGNAINTSNRAVRPALWLRR